MWLDYIMQFATLCVVAITSYYIGYDKGEKDSEARAKEEHYLTD